MKMIRLVVQVDDTIVNRQLMTDLLKEVDYVFDKTFNTPIKKLEQINCIGLLFAKEVTPETE